VHAREGNNVFIVYCFSYLTRWIKDEYNKVLFMPICTKFAEHAFSYAGPSAWNGAPSFACRCWPSWVPKTYFFTAAHNVYWYFSSWILCFYDRCNAPMSMFVIVMHIWWWWRWLDVSLSLYGLEACPLLKSDLSSLDFVTVRLELSIIVDNILMLSCLVLSGLIVSEGSRKSSPNVTIFFVKSES